MIDLTRINSYDFVNPNNRDLLEEFMIFSICVAGKAARAIAPRVHSLIEGRGAYFPLEYIYSLYPNHKSLAPALAKIGIGCYNQKAETIYDLAEWTTKTI